MTYKVIMPLLGESMEEGVLVRWFKKEGEKVERGEPLFEVETDKAVLEVESFFTGYLRKILLWEKEKARVGEVIAYMTDSLEEPVEE